MKFFSLVFLFISTHVWALETETPEYQAEVQVVVRPLQFEGPKIEIHEGIQHVILTPLYRFQLQDDERLIQNQFLMIVTGKVVKGSRINFNGQFLKLDHGTWSTTVVLSPGNNVMSVFVFDEKRKVSHYEIDFQLLDYRGPGETRIEPPKIDLSQHRREQGWTFEGGVSTGTYDLQIVTSANVVDKISNGILTIDGIANASVVRWFDSDHQFFRDIAAEVQGTYLLPTSGRAPTYYQIRAGLKGRYFLTDDYISPFVMAGMGFEYYYFKHRVTLTNNLNLIDDPGFYFFGGGNLPILETFSLEAKVGYGMIPTSSSTSRLIDVSAGFLFELARDLWFRLSATYSDYLVVENRRAVPLKHQLVQFNFNVVWDL